MSQILYTVGVLGRFDPESGCRWFEVVSRHSLISEAIYSKRALSSSFSGSTHEAVVKDGDLESGWVEVSK